jgi:aldose 1-epimerase
VTVRYTLANNGSLTLEYSAVTDKKTVVSLTNHTYFNLGGYDSGKVFDHELYLDCDRAVEIREGLIPTGNIVSVEKTPFDFRNNKMIGRDFDLSYEQLALAKGYDHCLVFTEREEPMSAPRAVAYDKKSGRMMELYTDAPAVHFYTANFMKNPDYPLKNGYPQGAQNAFCLETERMPDSMNHAGFTDCSLDVGEVYSTKTVFKFSVK